MRRTRRRFVRPSRAAADRSRMARSPTTSRCGRSDARSCISIPHIGLNVQNYLEHRDAFLGAPGYTEERFRLMRQILPALTPLFRRALDERLRMPLGSDAVAGAHGRNARELVVRVREGGQRSAEAIVSATSLAAESLGMADRIGTLAPGLQADAVAVTGDPLRDIRMLESVVFVMANGRVHRSP
jgi:imidazolonepropionase-like amidohydrolase